MSRRPARFTEADVRRAVKVAKQFGMAVEIAPDGTIRIIPSEPERWPSLENAVCWLEDRPAHSVTNKPQRVPLETFEKGSPEAAQAKGRLINMVTRFTRTGKPATLSGEDFQDYVALPKEERIALDKELTRLWAENLISCPLNKLERTALRALSVTKANEAVSWKHARLGPQTAERLEARGFLRIVHATDDPEGRRPSYVLTSAGLKAAQELSRGEE